MGVSASLMGINPLPPHLKFPEENEFSEFAEGQLCLTLMVLTSDDELFRTCLSLPIAAGNHLGSSMISGREDLIRICSAVMTRSRAAALSLIYAPGVGLVSGDQFSEVMSLLTDGAPVFGAFGVDDSPSFNKNCFVVSSEGAFRDRLGFIFMAGNVQSRFYTSTISREKILHHSAVVTRSDGSIIKSLNGKPVMEFLDSMGIGSAAEKGVLTNLSFIADYRDGTPYFSRTLLAMTPEKFLIAGGDIREGANIRIGVFEQDDMLSTARIMLERALQEAEEDKAGGASPCALVYSCATRISVLGMDPLGELNMIRSLTSAPFMLASAGGEICPVESATEHRLINRFHNQTLSVCVLR
jgi:hypothetical protein